MSSAIANTRFRPMYDFLTSVKRFCMRRKIGKVLQPYTASSMNYWLYPQLTYDAVKNYPLLLDTLIELTLNTSSPLDMPSQSTEWGLQNPTLTSELAEAFARHGSDKSTSHDYHRVYADVLDSVGVNNRLRILEIGIGTNNPGLVSTMGSSGKPGASLRGFRDIFPQSQIYGADVDTEILFSEERISTGYVDQTNFESFSGLCVSLKQDQFDLIVDDGLHSATANLASINFALEHLSNNGVLVVEDIDETALPLWRPIARIVASKHRCSFVKCKNSYVFILYLGNTQGV